MAEPDVAEAVTLLGLGFLVTHIEAHLSPYGVAAGDVGVSTTEKASDAWHQAFEYLVIDARKAYRDDPERQALFLSDYVSADGTEFERGKVRTSAPALGQVVRRRSESEPLTVGQEVDKCARL